MRNVVPKLHLSNVQKQTLDDKTRTLVLDLVTVAHLGLIMQVDS